MIMRVAKWGNSLAVRLPQSVVNVLKLKEGDSIDIQIADERAFRVAKAPKRKEFIARLLKYRGRMPADFKFDRWDANARG
jgi:antitoxin MazE